MSRPRFDHWHIDLNTMTVTYIGRTDDTEVLKHPDGWKFVVMDSETWMRSDSEPVWRKINDGKEKGFNIATTAND